MVALNDLQLIRVWGQYQGGSIDLCYPTVFSGYCPIAAKEIVYNNHGVIDNDKGWVVQYLWPLEKGGSNTYANLFISHTDAKRINENDTEGFFANGTEFKVVEGGRNEGGIVGVLYIKVNGTWVAPLRSLI